MAIERAASTIPTAAVQAHCVIAVPRNPSRPPVLINASDPAALVSAMSKLGYAPDEYVIGRARLADVALVDSWDHESYVRFDSR